MKKFALAAAVAGSLIAMPANAENASHDNDPFVSTQASIGLTGLAGAAAVIGTIGIVIGIVAADGT